MDETDGAATVDCADAAGAFAARIPRTNAATTQPITRVLYSFMARAFRCASAAALAPEAAVWVQRDRVTVRVLASTVYFFTAAGDAMEIVHTRYVALLG